MKKKHKKRKKHNYEEDCVWESDENFAMIMGYTSGGAPYGLTWEEFKKIEGLDEDDDIMADDDEELPF